MIETGREFRVIGLMSGTSLDGLDVAGCVFRHDGDKWHYRIETAITLPYPDRWRETLLKLPESDAVSFCEADREYGYFLGQVVKGFIRDNGFQPDLVASHGHTIFHRPADRLTVQVGAGSAIAAETGLTVACDFRTTDVAQGGQGAPLVPVGDQLLFDDYDACLNLGGFANISMVREARRIAFDICPANIILNRMAAMAGLAYDEDGRMARSGTVVLSLLDALDALPYYILSGPKSLGREWLEESFMPVVHRYDFPASDLARTVCEHIAGQVSRSMSGEQGAKVLVTGGGAHNIFLMERIRARTGHNFVVPDKMTVDYKEALVFALLGLLRWLGEVNILRSVTGGRKDLSGGAVYLG
jgi:anhydro-N-acetylmuramic acid kinase